MPVPFRAANIGERERTYTKDAGRDLSSCCTQRQVRSTVAIGMWLQLQRAGILHYGGTVYPELWPKVTFRPRELLQTTSLGTYG